MKTKTSEIRALPVRPRAFEFETPTRYFEDLQVSNRLGPTTMNRFLSECRGPDDQDDRASREFVLRAFGLLSDRALVDPAPRHADGSTCGRCVIGQTQRLACRRCTQGKKITLYPHLGRYVCRKHNVWIGPGATLDQQIVVSPAVGKASVRLDRLVRTNRVSAVVIAEVTARVEDTLRPSITDHPSTIHLTVVATLALITNRCFNDHLLDSRITFNDAYALLSDNITRIVGQRTPAMADAIWAMYRPVFWRRQQRLAGDTPAAPEQHDFNPGYLEHIVAPGQLEPFDQFADSSKRTLDPAEKMRWQLESVSGLFLVARTPPSCTMPSWAICDQGHRHETTPRTLARALANRLAGCPVCAGTVVIASFNSLAALKPSLAPYFHPTKNAPKTAAMTFGDGRKAVWWSCSECGSAFRASPHSCNPLAKCPACLHPSKRRTNWNTVEIDPTFEQGVALSDVAQTSKEVHHWRCRADSRHTWMSSAQTALRARTCPACDGRLLIVGVTDLVTRYPSVAANWDYERNYPLRPENFTAQSGQVVYWKCSGHSYPAAINVRRLGNHCPYCTGKRPLAGFNTISAVRAEIVHEWHPYLNVKTPDQVTWASGYEAFWVCPQGHIYLLAVYRRTTRRGRGCTECTPVKPGHGKRL